MNENQFSAMLAIIVPQIVEQIVKNSNISEVTAVECFYRSHYSPLLLYTMYQDELLTGHYDYPEET